MDLDELKGRIGATKLDDTALQSLLAAAVEAIEARYGTQNDEAIETRRPSGPLIRLARRAQEVISVSERFIGGFWTGVGFGGTSVELETDDWELRPGGLILERLPSGSHPARRWRGAVTVHYWPTDDGAERDRVAVDLVKLEMNYVPTLVSTTIGTWSETYNKLDNAYQAERETILASLRMPFIGAI